MFVKWIATQLLLILGAGLIAFPAQAFSGLGSATAPVKKNPPTALQTSQDFAVATFERSVGHRFTPSEKSQIASLVDTMNEVKSRPQSVAWNSGSVEWTVIACGQFKVQLANLVPTQPLRELARQFGGTVEAQPCLDFSTYQSFLLLGGSAAVGAGPGILTAGIQIGLYFGASQINKPIEGTYMFVRLAKQFSLIKGSVTVAWDKDHCKLQNATQVTMGNDCQMILFGGGGIDISGWIKSYFSAPAAIVTGQPIGTPAGLMARVMQWLSGVELSMGAMVSIQEFPWYERIHNQGMDMKTAFQDVGNYLRH